ncbi:MAG: type II toxin-antitoxin system HicB family antitoxin [Planctomycetes bacterium]|nr:type II toxin-antitoxin system HicB family antitoxin [Planctomycetota bacterium]
MAQQQGEERSFGVERKRVFQVIIEQDEAGYYVAECPALKGCYTQGKTREEAMENIKDVIRMCVEQMEKDDRTGPS